MDPAILQRHAAHTHGRPPDGMLERRLELHRMLDDVRDARVVPPTLRRAAGEWPRRVIAALVTGAPGRRWNAGRRWPAAGETVLQDTLIDENTAYLESVGTPG